MAIVCPERLNKLFPRRLVLARCGEEHSLADKIAKHAHLALPLARTEFIAPDTRHLTPIDLRPRRRDMGLQHSLQALVGLAHVTGHRGHRHLPQQ